MDVRELATRTPPSGHPFPPQPPESLLASVVVSARCVPGSTLRRRRVGRTDADSRPGQLARHLSPPPPTTRKPLPLCNAVPEIAQPPSVAPGCSPPLALSAGCSRLVRNIAWRVIIDALDQLLFSGQPITLEFREVYTELVSIRDANEGRQRQLRRLSAELTRLARRLAAYPGGLPPRWQTLSDCLGFISTWLDSIGDQWPTLELALEQYDGQQPLLAKVTRITGLTRRLLAEPALQKLLGEGAAQGLEQRLVTLDQTLAQVRLWQALPGDAGLGDYLQLLGGNPWLGGAVADSLQRLGWALGQVQTGYPATGTSPEKIAWVVHTLAQPTLRQPLQPHLERLMGSPERVAQLLAICQLGEPLRHFPTQGTQADQALWLLALLKQHAGASEALAWLQPLQTTLGADPATLNLLHRLLELKQHPDAWKALLKDVFATLALPVAKQVAGLAVPVCMPWAQAPFAFYQQSSPEQSWGELGLRLGGWLASLAKPFVVGALMGDPLASVTVGYAEALQTHTDGEQTWRWFIAHAPAGDLRLQMAYSQYLTALLVWQVYQACQGDDPLDTEQRLNQLARQLKEYQVVNTYPQLAPMIDLLPLLPLLMQARCSVVLQPGADTWLAWCSQWLRALGDSAAQQHSAQALHKRLSTQLENWLAKGLMAAFSALPVGLPGAAAATITAPAVPRVTASAVTAAGAGKGLLLGGISLEAVGLGILGYSLWQARQAVTTERPLVDAEKTLIGAKAPQAGGQSRRQMIPVLLGITALATGGVLLYRWAHSAPQALVLEQGASEGEEHEPDFDSPVYTPFINIVMAETLQQLQAATTSTARHHPANAGTRPSSSMTLSRRPRDLVLDPVQPEVAPPREDPAAMLARRALDFSKYEATVAARFDTLWQASLTSITDATLDVEQKKGLYLQRFHHALRRQMLSKLAEMNHLKASGTGNNSPYRNNLIWIATLGDEAQDVMEQLPSTVTTQAYREAWAPASVIEQLNEINRIFVIKEPDDETYYEQQQAWLTLSKAQEADYLYAADLSNTQKMWRCAIVNEQHQFHALVDDYVAIKNFDELPDLLTNIFKLRIEMLGAERYEQFNQQHLSMEETLARQVAVQEMEMRKYVASHLFSQEQENFIICQALINRGELRHAFGGQRAVFESAIIAYDLTQARFSTQLPMLDDDDKIIAFNNLNQGAASNEVWVYLNKSSALAYFMMTDSSESSDYVRWTAVLSENFATAFAQTQYFRMFFKPEPAHYRGLHTFKKSSDSDSWVDFYQQFIDYKEKSIDFDSARIAYSALLGQGLTDYDICQMQPQRIVYADLVVYNHTSPQVTELLKTGNARVLGTKFHEMLNAPTTFPGTIGFIPLEDGRLLAMSGTQLKVAVKLFDQPDVDASPALRELCRLTALPYQGTVAQLEGKQLIDQVLRPLFTSDTDTLLGNNGFPLLKAPLKFRGSWERTQPEVTHSRTDAHLLDVANEVMKENLTQWVGVLKTAKKDPDFWSMVLSLLPLYSELRDYNADPEHRLDGNRVMWDLSGLLISILPAIGRMAQLSLTGLKTLCRTATEKLLSGMQANVVLQHILRSLISNPQFMPLGLKGFRYATYIALEAISPVPIRLSVSSVMLTSKYIRKHIQKNIAAGRPPLSSLYSSVGDQLDAGAPLARAEMTKLDAVSRVSLGADKTITLRNSHLTPDEVVDLNLALLRPVTRTQKKLTRNQDHRGYQAQVHLCAPKAHGPARLPVELDCLEELGYLRVKNIVNEGVGYTVYNLPKLKDSFVVKEFRSQRLGDREQRLRKANNNKNAYNRFYGSRQNGYADVFSEPGEGPVVALLQYRPGKTLEQIIAADDRTAIEGIRLHDKAQLVDGLVNQLSDMGIYYDAVDFSGIAYDSPSRSWSLNNFDNATFIEHWQPLNTVQMTTLKLKFTNCLADFAEQTKLMQPNDHGINIDLLNIEQLKELNVQRNRYLSHVKAMAGGKHSIDFNYAKLHHRGFDVANIKKTASELTLTLKYNALRDSTNALHLGALSGFIEHTRTLRCINQALMIAAKYSRNLGKHSIKQVIVPQSFWLAAATASSTEVGRCYPLVLAVSVALKQNSVSPFFLNILRSAAKTDVSRNEILHSIDQITTLNNAEFIAPALYGRSSSVVEIVRYVDSLTTNGLFTLTTDTHAMMVGVTFDSISSKTYHFYEPNIGIFAYRTAKQLSEALMETIGKAEMASQYGARDATILPRYKLALIDTYTLADKRLQIRREDGSIANRTVAELSSDLINPSDCFIPPGPAARARRALDCVPTEAGIVQLMRIQEGLVEQRLPDATTYQAVLDFGARLLANYRVYHAYGLDARFDVAFLEVTRQRLMTLTEAPTPRPGNAEDASAVSIERRSVLYEYLNALMQVAHQVRHFEAG